MSGRSTVSSHGQLRRLQDSLIVLTAARCLDVRRWRWTPSLLKGLACFDGLLGLDQTGVQEYHSMGVNLVSNAEDLGLL